MAIGISKPYFEAIAVGIYLALIDNPNINLVAKKELVIDKNNRNEFYKLIEGRYRTHTAQKIRNRIEYVKNRRNLLAHGNISFSQFLNVELVIC